MSSLTGTAPVAGIDAFAKRMQERHAAKGGVDYLVKHGNLWGD